MSDEKTPQIAVTIRPRAIEDIEKQAEYLKENASSEVAQRFLSAIMDAVERIRFMPGIGAPREVKNPRLSGLRMLIVPGFRNHLLFYLTPEGNVEIIRLFHGAQDIYYILESEE